MGGTQYAKQIVKQFWGLPPVLDLNSEKKVHDALRELVNSGFVETAHDVSDGGLAFAIAEGTFCHGVGARIELASGLRPELLLFHEGPSRAIVSTTELKRVEEICARHGVPATVIGCTGGSALTISNNGSPLIDVNVSELTKVWSGALESALRSEAHV
jgi:phosphoribosylformylglycinamidine synthase